LTVDQKENINVTYGPNSDDSAEALMHYHEAGCAGKSWSLIFGPHGVVLARKKFPILEQLQTDKAMSEVALFGITEESASDVREWLSQYKRSFVTLIDAKNTFADFRIKPIPTLVVINRQGLVVDYDLGFHSERLVRELIRKHLSN
jgi:hypothetical protein